MAISTTPEPHINAFDPSTGQAFRNRVAWPMDDSPAQEHLDHVPPPATRPDSSDAFERPSLANPAGQGYAGNGPVRPLGPPPLNQLGLPSIANSTTQEDLDDVLTRSTASSLIDKVGPLSVESSVIQEDPDFGPAQLARSMKPPPLRKLGLPSEGNPTNPEDSQDALTQAIEPPKLGRSLKASITSQANLEDVSTRPMKPPRLDGPGYPSEHQLIQTLNALCHIQGYNLSVRTAKKSSLGVRNLVYLYCTPVKGPRGKGNRQGPNTEGTNKEGANVEGTNEEGTNKAGTKRKRPCPFRAVGVLDESSGLWRLDRILCGDHSHERRLFPPQVSKSAEVNKTTGDSLDHSGREARSLPRPY